MLKTPLDSRQIEDLLSSAIVDAARGILSSGRLWKLTDRLGEARPDGDGPSSPGRAPAGAPVSPGTAGAYVLDGGAEPYLTIWDGESWACECPEGSAGRPCVHLTALLLTLADLRPDDERLFRFGRASDTADSVSPDGLFITDAAASTHPDSVFTAADLSDPRLDPDLDLLFFVEPDHLVLKPVVVLGPETDVTTMWKKAIRPASPGPEGAAFKDLSGHSWRLAPATAAMRDGVTGTPRPRHAAEDLPSAMADPAKEMSGSLLAALFGTGGLSRDPIVTPKGEEWAAIEATAVRLRFEPLLNAGEGEPLYEPVVDLLDEKDGVTRVIEGGLVPNTDAWIILDASKAVAGILKGGGEHLWFIRLMLSRRVMGASDIRARFMGRRPVPEEIRVVLPDMPETLRELTPTLVLQISGKGEVTDFHPRWRYGARLVSPAEKGDVVMDAGGGKPKPIGLRNRLEEKALFDTAEIILADGLSWRRGRYAALTGNGTVPLRLEAPLAEVLAEYGLPLMDAGVELRLEDRPVRTGGALRVNTRRSGDLMEMNAVVDSSPLELDEWMTKGGLVRTKEAYFTLTDKALEQLRFLKNHGMADTGFLSTSPDNLSLIDAVYAEIEASQETSMDLERKRSLYMTLAAFSDEGTPPPPDSFHAVLRPYQRHGYAWLLYLRENRLGGCLADDMGLGKTVQTLAYLSRLKADGSLGGTLLVGPVVTLGNWEAEIQRFTPNLSCRRYAGPAQRRLLPEPEDSVDVILVSYQTLRNDIEKFLEREWDHVVLDEAHYVKNSSSRTFKAVRSLKAVHRLSLTGTPLENHLNELWSQMNFLNPGILGSLSHFNELYVRPVEKDGETSTLSRLSDIVSPFILRRRKTDVLEDLPPKDEAVIRCDMTDDQAEAYHSMKALYLNQVTGLLSDGGLQGSRIEIFSILSKLRLLAIHPPMAGEPFAGVSSGKMEVLDNLMEEILEEDHKTLVFSQFLGALDRAERTCRDKGWRYSRLTGSTRNREEPIRQFTEDPNTRVFLLSLRAGGVGINLTAADYVILLDPWWNPAVEAQAVDRAHRMGQKRSVMAYRLITSGTIEEKVLELQERKKDLIAGVLGDGGLPKLSEDEILSLFS